MDTANGNVNRLASLRKREAAIKAAIAAEQIKRHKQAEKEHARHARTVGECVLADLEAHPEVRPSFEQSLKRTATGRDVEFLQSKGWRL